MPRKPHSIQLFYFLLNIALLVRIVFFFSETCFKACDLYWRGGWSQWSSYMKDCQAKCGSGITMRLRTCSEPLPHRNFTCPGYGSEIKPCVTERCPNVFLDSSGILYFDGSNAIKFESALDLPISFPALVISCRIYPEESSGVVIWRESCPDSSLKSRKFCDSVILSLEGQQFTGN